MESLYFDVLAGHPQPLPLESFTSYISRLSEANGLRATEEIARLLFFNTNVSSNNIRQLSDFPLTSWGELPLISVCTDHSMLMTTFFHLAKKFGQDFRATHLKWFFKDAIALNLRYCPLCLMSQPIPHYLLLWRFLHLPVCPYHGCSFLNNCMHCGNNIPLFSVPPKIPFCASCKKDLRQCKTSKIGNVDGQGCALSIEEVLFLISPEECELEKDIPFLLSNRLAYKAKLKSTKILHSIPNELPRELVLNRSNRNKEDAKIKVDKKNVRRCRAMFINYLHYTRFLGITFNDLFNREFFTAVPSDPDEHTKQIFIMFCKQWQL